MESWREALFAYAMDTYHAQPEHLWLRYPDYAVLRRSDNGKWFALVMDVQRSKLGLSGEDRVDILNVKLADPLLAELLTQQEGFLRGYHLSRGNWISILLDGTVPFPEICRWLRESYQATAPRAKSRSGR